MNGRVLPNTPIAVDVWRQSVTPHARLFFLSHAHSDHVQGLTKKWAETIYCSELTAKLIKHKIGVQDEFLHPLTFNEPHIIKLDAEGLETMAVTLIDANHCAGAAMFLFEGYFGRILYTGDFRYHPSMFAKDTVLGRVVNVDDLYMDNTYCHEDCNFPSQEQAREQFVDLVCRNFDKHIVIVTNELGKEDLFEELALTTRTYIQVRPEKLEIIRLLGLKDVFTTDPSEERIRLIPRRHFSVQNAKKWDTEHPTMVIVPTSLMRGVGETPYKNIPNIRVVPYSEHSSYNELLEFVERVRPKQLLPIVMYGRGIFGKDCKNRLDFTAFEKFLEGKPRMDFVVPESVQEFMNRPSVRMKKPRVVLEQLVVQKRRQSLVKKGIEYQTPEKENCDSSETENSTMNGAFEDSPQNNAEGSSEKKNSIHKKKNSGKKKDGAATECTRELRARKLKVHEYESQGGCKTAVVEVYLDTPSESSIVASQENVMGASQETDEEEMEESVLEVPMEVSQTNGNPMEDSELAVPLAEDEEIVIEQFSSPIIISNGSGDSKKDGKSSEITSEVVKVNGVQEQNRGPCLKEVDSNLWDDSMQDIDEYIGRVELGASGDGPSKTDKSAVATESKCDGKQKPVTGPECRCELLSPQGLVDILNLIVRPAAPVIPN